MSSLTDTHYETLPPPPPPLPSTEASADEPAPGVRRPTPRHRWFAVPLVGVALLALVGIVIVALLPASLVADKEVGSDEDPAILVEEATPFARVPASATAVDDRVTFGELEGLVDVDEDRNGDIYFVTITEPQQSVLSWWVGRDEEEVTFLTREEKYGRSTPTQDRAISLTMMRTATQVAQYVALRAVGYEEARLVPGEVVIGEMVCLEAVDGECVRTAPSDEQLDVGDRLVELDGRRLNTVDDVIAALVDKEAGDSVTVRLERQGVGPLTVTVELTTSPDDSGRTIIGFVPFDTATIELPFEIDIDTGAIGGPSAGLAFTLTLIDELSAGDLTGGADIAVTGAILDTGDVGAIGGLVQKTSAVRQNGIDYFLVPTAQGEEQIAAARAVAGDDLEIIPVATLDEALAALEALGGDPLVVDAP